MLSLIVIAAVLVLLGVVAQIQRAAIAAPAPLSQRVEVEAVNAPAGAEVEIVLRGAPGIAVSVHDLEWPPGVSELSATGPLTLVGPKDERRYVVTGAAAGSTVIAAGLFDQLTLRRFSVAVAVPDARDGDTVGSAGLVDSRLTQSTE